MLLRAPARRSVARGGADCAEIERAVRLLAQRRIASAARSASSGPRGPPSRGGIRQGPASTRCTAAPWPARRRAQVSWRSSDARQSAPRARSRSSGATQRTVTGCCRRLLPGSQLLEEPQALLGEGQRRRSAAVGPDASGGAGAPSDVERAVDALGEPGDGRAPRRARAGAARRRRLARIARSRGWRGASGHPGRRSRRAQTDPRRCRASRRRSRPGSPLRACAAHGHPARARPSSRGAGSAVRSTLPFGVRGSAGSTTNADGTM